MTQYGQPEVVSSNRQIVSTVMQTQMQAVPRTVMVPQRSQTMTQTMETQMVPQPRTFMTTQTQQVMRPSWETVPQQVPTMSWREEKHTVTRRHTNVEWEEYDGEYA